MGRGYRAVQISELEGASLKRGARLVRGDLDRR